MSDSAPRVNLRDFANFKMGETIIAATCTGDGLPVYSADTREAPWNFSSHCRVKNRHGCIVVGVRGTIGHPRLPPFDEFAATQTTIVVEPNRTAFDPQFLLHALTRIPLPESDLKTFQISHPAFAGFFGAGRRQTAPNRLAWRPARFSSTRTAPPWRHVSQVQHA